MTVISQNKDRTLSKKEVAATLAGLMLGVLMSALDNTVVGTAMPRIVKDLQGLGLYSWPFVVYLLTATLAIPIFGRMADQVGRRLVFLSGLIEFIISSLLCGLSPNMETFIFFRGLQGLGGGILVSNAFALAGEISTPERRGAYMGMIGSMFGVSGLLGPSVGGLLADTIGWRWAFYINLPLGAAALAVLLVGLRHFKETRSKLALDPVGILLFILAVSPLMLALNWGGRDYAWSSPLILSLLGAAAVFAVFFLLVERKSPQALLPSWLFRSLDFNMSALAVFLSNAVFFGAILFLPLWFQEVLGISATSSGLALTPLLVAYTVCSVVGGQFLGKMKTMRGFALLGGLIALAGCVLLVFIEKSSGEGPLILAMTVLGIGLGINVPVFTVAAQNSVEPRFIGLATATSNFFRNLGAAAGAAVMGSVFLQKVNVGLAQIDWGQTPGELRQVLQDPKVLMSPAALRAVGEKVPAAYQAAFQGLLKQIDDRMAVAVLAVFAVMLVFGLAVLLPLIFLRGTRKELVSSKPM